MSRDESGTTGRKFEAGHSSVPAPNAADDVPPTGFTMKDLQEHVEALKQRQGWRDKSLELRALFLMSEIGEMAKELLALKWASAEDAERIRRRLGMEMYDVMWNLMDLAMLAEVDLDEAFATKAEVNKRRQWYE